MARIAAAALLLYPLACLLLISLMQGVSAAAVQGTALWQDLPTWWFAVGILLGVLVLAAQATILNGLHELCLYVYVLGHELTHALATYCCRGKVKSIYASAQGGYAEISKQNTFILLAPYFIPLWAILWVILFAGLYALGGGQGWLIFLYAGLGFWWFFHLFWSVWMIPREQPDLETNGRFYSMSLIYLLNLIILGGLLLVFGLLDWSLFCQALTNNATALWHYL